MKRECLVSRDTRNEVGGGDGGEAESSVDGRHSTAATQQQKQNQSTMCRKLQPPFEQPLRHLPPRAHAALSLRPAERGRGVRNMEAQRRRQRSDEDRTGTNRKS